jgi:hypothetical protein
MLHDDRAPWKLKLLVRVVPKLAERISIDCCSRCALHLSSAERVARIKARTYFPCDNRVSVESSLLKAAAYLARRRWLYLQFRSGEIYRYFDFPAQLYRDFLAVESKGTYFGKHIRNDFQ